MEVTVDWGDLEKSIAKCIADVEGPVRRKAGKIAGQNLGEALARNTPRGEKSGDRSWTAQRKLDKIKGTKTSFKALADDVTVGPVGEDGMLNVGYGKNTYWRAHFPNMGTEYQAGQHFVEKTAETELESVMQDYMSELKRGLGL